MQTIKHQIKSIRPFIGARDFETSKSFYSDLGFEETSLLKNLSLFRTGDFAFYLQDYYVKDWLDNSMVLMEVENVDEFWNYLKHLELEKKYPGIKLIPVKKEDWGRECLITDPSGVLWHFAEFPG